jgi:hypothetical protein
MMYKLLLSFADVFYVVSLKRMSFDNNSQNVDSELFEASSNVLMLFVLHESDSLELSKDRHLYKRSRCHLSIRRNDRDVISSKIIEMLLQ